ncbi:hypothetical protein GOODEAATRI_011629 [Goodea atripinnis]|uniref:Secreted protein n=1 Tax=Goodea atripinnis TaxID=208336 RepID=A0ABV0P3P0_9TELE
MLVLYRFSSISWCCMEEPGCSSDLILRCVLHAPGWTGHAGHIPRLQPLQTLTRPVGNPSSLIYYNAFVTATATSTGACHSSSCNKKHPTKQLKQTIHTP